MSYYKDSDKLTFDEADSLTTKFIREYGEVKVYVKSKHVADAYEVTPSRHNLLRICASLDNHLESVERDGVTTRQFRITNDR